MKGKLLVSPGLDQVNNQSASKYPGEGSHDRHAGGVKIHIQSKMARNTGNGYQGILYGSDCVPFRFRNNITPIAWPTNCTMIRIASMPLMTSLILNSRLKIKASDAILSKETYGNPRLGCNLANTLKKEPSAAAAYGTREYPSITAKGMPVPPIGSSPWPDWRQYYHRAFEKHTDNKFIFALSLPLVNFLPGYDRTYADIKRKVQYGDAHDGNKHAAGYIFSRIPDLCAQVTNIIITQVTVNGLYTGLAKGK